MGKATLAHQRAIGEIGQARAQKLTDAGLTVLFTADVERMKERIAELEKRNKILSDLTLGTTEQTTVAAQVLKEAMGR